MEQREKPFIPSMSGQEVADMFGDKQLLKLEAQHKVLEGRMKELSKKIADAKEGPEEDPNETELLEQELLTVRELMREHDRVIRKSSQEWGNKRGPVTLH